MTQQQVAKGGQPSCDGTAEVKRPREEQRFFGAEKGRGTFVSLFDCCVFFCITLTPYGCTSSAQKNVVACVHRCESGWRQQCVTGRGGNRTDAGGTTHRSRPPPEVGEATGMCSVIFVLLFSSSLLLTVLIFQLSLFCEDYQQAGWGGAG